MRSERAALVLSAAAAVLLAAVGIAAAVATGSGAILLDGLFNLCFCVTALFTLRVARLLARPDDERLPLRLPLLRAAHQHREGPAHPRRLRLRAGRRRHRARLRRPRGDVRPGARSTPPSPPSSASPSSGRCAAAGARARWSPPTSTPGPSTPPSPAASSPASSSPPGCSAPATPAPPPTSTRRWSPSSSSSPSPCRCAWRCSGLLALLNRAPSDAGGRRHGGRGPRARSATCRSRRLWVRAIQPGRTAYVVVHVLVAAAAPRSTSPPPTGCAAR